MAIPDADEKKTVAEIRYRAMCPGKRLAVWRDRLCTYQVATFVESDILTCLHCRHSATCRTKPS